MRASEEAGRATGQLEFCTAHAKAAEARGEMRLVPMLLSDGVGDAEPAMLDCAFSSLSVMVEVEVERPKPPRGLRCVSLSSGRRGVRG